MNVPQVGIHWNWIQKSVPNVLKVKLRRQENFVIHVTLAALEVWKVSVTSVLKVNFSLPRVKRAARTASTEKSTEHERRALHARLENEVET